MAYKASGLLNADLTENNDTSAKFAPGTRTFGIDPVYGIGEFIYLRGLASTAVGEVVTYDLTTATTATTRGVATNRGPIAVALGATVAAQYGWYQIFGLGIVKAGTVATNKPLFLTATPGLVDDAVVATDKIDGAVTKSADGTPSAGFALVQLSYPCANGAG